MNCSCIKDTAQAFDFHLESLDCKTLIFTDLSNWMLEEPYVVPAVHDVQITFPEGQTILTEFRGESITKYTAEGFGIGKCFPDGIYCFKVESCGYNYTRHKAVTCTLYCQLDTLISKAATDEDWSVIEELSNLIISIKKAAEMDKHKQANELYSIASKKLSRLECSCPCN